MPPNYLPIILFLPAKVKDRAREPRSDQGARRGEGGTSAAATGSCRRAAGRHERGRRKALRNYWVMLGKADFIFSFRKFLMR